MDYFCKECQKEVFVTLEGKITRTCEHEFSTVIAPRTSVLFGEGGSGVDVETSMVDKLKSAMRNLAMVLAK